MIILLAILAAAATASEGKIICERVDCSIYDFNVIPHSNGYSECRFKMRNDNSDLTNKFGSGLQVHRYKDPSGNKPTQDCPKGGKLRITESPTKSHNIKYPGVASHKQCCVPKVLDFCYYKVDAFFDCGKSSPEGPKNDREDDKLLRVEVLYRRNLYRMKNGKKVKEVKTVTAIFDGVNRRVTCQNNFNGKKQTLKYGFEGKKQCGDYEISVQISAAKVTYKSGYKYNLVKVQRYECNSQYVGCLIDPSNRDKFTVRTAVNPDKRQNRYDGAKIGYILAETFAGKCGPIVKNVKRI